MIWLTWRQFRGQALTAAAALAALTVSLVAIGLALRHSYDIHIVGCEATGSCDAGMNQLERQYLDLLQLSGVVVLGVPAIIGTFWGAPLISREFEHGTHRLVWNQSVTRTRWLAVKLGVIGLAAMALAGILSLLVTWAASPFDALAGGRFTAVNFAARNIVPPGYAIFAFVLGTVVGLFVRRLLPAMAITLAVFTAVQVLVPTAVRVHLLPPVTDTVAFSANVMRGGGAGLQLRGGTVWITDYTVPGAWAISQTSELLTATGESIGRDRLQGCMRGAFDKDMACLTAMDLHFTSSYHPGSRYWPFQWIELAGFLGLSALLAGLGFWRIRRRLA